MQYAHMFGNISSDISIEVVPGYFRHQPTVIVTLNKQSHHKTCAGLNGNHACSGQNIM